MTQQRKVSFMKQEVTVRSESNQMASASVQRQTTQVQELTEQGSLGNVSMIREEIRPV